MNNTPKRRYRRYAVSMPDRKADTAVLDTCKAQSGWRVIGSPTRSGGRVTITVRFPVGAVQIYTFPELRALGWDITSSRRRPTARKRPPAKDGGRQRHYPRGPRPIKHMPVFGIPADAKLCTGCQRWFPLYAFWNEARRVLMDDCKVCRSRRRLRPAPITVTHVAPTVKDVPSARGERAASEHPRPGP